MKCRNQVLNGLFQARLFYLEENIPAARMFHIASTRRDSIASTCRRDNIHSEVFLSANLPLSHVINQIRFQDITSFDRGATAIGEAIYVDQSLKLSPLLFWTTQDQAEVQRLLCRWRLGRVVWHQDCQNCGRRRALSRNHAITCARIDEPLMEKYWDIPSEPYRYNFIDSMLNHNFLKKDEELWNDAYWAVSQIGQLCLHVTL
jgi:hypothetical protein